jgi:hypothetical protein
MMQFLRGCCLIGLLAVLVVGCGRPSTPANPPAPDQPVLGSNAELKQRLEYIANSGIGGSALGGLREAVEKVGDATLVKDLGDLERTQDPEQLKAIAKRMASKL